MSLIDVPCLIYGDEFKITITSTLIYNKHDTDNDNIGIWDIADPWMT